MLCFDKIGQPNGRQFFTDTGYIHTQSIIIHIKLIVPEKIHNIAAVAYFPCVLEKIVKNFQFVFRQLCFLAVILDKAALQM